MVDCNYYFSFGSNTSTWRISKNCPPDSAPPEFITAARLDNHVLQFSGPDWRSWRGAVATVTPKDGEVVWGVVWNVSNAHLHNLDVQEGKSYKREVISVTTAAGNPVSCYTYIMHEGFGTSLPSKPYLDTLIEGAREHDVPKFYIEHLEKLEHNEYSGPVFPR